MLDFEEKDAGTPDVSQLPKIIGDLGRAFEDFKSKNEKELQEIKAGTKAAPADLTKVEEALTKLHAAKDAIELKLAGQEKAQKQLEALLARPGLGHNGGPALEDSEKQLKAFNLLRKAGSAPVSAEIYADYRKSFETVLRKSDKGWSADEVKTLAVGLDPSGGYLVPADMSGRIVQRVFEISPMRQLADIVTIGVDVLEGINDTDEADEGGWVSEMGTRADTDTPAIGKWSIPTHEIYAQPKVTLKMLEDGVFDVEAWLNRKVSDRFARVENAAFLTGNGVGKPRGLTTYDTAATADGSRAWGTFEHVATANNGDFASSTPADILFDVVGAMKDAYLANATWLTRREVITKVRKFKESTTNGYLWQPGLQQGKPQTLLGFPVSIAQDMPTLATGSLSMAFGDMKEGYQVVDRAGISTLRDPYTAKGYVKLFTRRRVGGGALNFDAVKFVKFGS